MLKRKRLCSESYYVDFAVGVVGFVVVVVDFIVVVDFVVDALKYSFPSLQESCFLAT
jgi:hypothetical protein